MDPITMMVASVGIQFFTNFANNKKNREIQAHQREFQKAVAERDFDRMRRAQAAAAQLVLELEEEVHKDRLGDIEDNYNKLLQDFAHGFAISNWPLNVLPFIMKGESFGSLIGGSTNSINMHCILTPSNCDWFNEYFYDELDIRVEAEMNNHWNAQSTHPVVYYGGAWNRRDIKPSGFSIIKPVDLDDIALLKNQLNKIPMMVITPYFDPYLHFRVQLWGMGKDSENPFRIDPIQGNVNIKDRIFSYDYNKDDQPELTDDFFNTTMEEFVPYLEKLIGYIVDKYFWCMYGTAPLLPQIAKDNQLRYCDVKSLNRDYDTMLDQSDKNFIAIYGADSLWSFVQQALLINNDNEKILYITKILCKICNAKTEEDLCTIDNLEQILSNIVFTNDEFLFIEKIESIIAPIKTLKAQSLTRVMREILKNHLCQNEAQINYRFPFITLHHIFELSIKEKFNLHNGDNLVIDISPEEHLITITIDGASRNIYPRINIQTDAVLVPQEIKEKQPHRLKIKKENLTSLMNKIALECDANLFHSIISLEKIYDYCNKVAKNIKVCNLYIRNDIPKDVVQHIDSNILQKLMYCEIICWNNDVITNLFYYDEIQGELKEKFLDNNILTIE